MSETTSAPPPATAAGAMRPAGAVPSAHLTVLPWVDPIVDDVGFDPRSRYVELFWLGVLGPTATWLIRRLAAGLGESPDGYELDLHHTARAMGLTYNPARSSPFTKAIQRCVMFGLAHPVDRSLGEGLAVRRRIPHVTLRHLQRMPETLQAAHHEWQRTTVSVDALSRAHRLATTLLDLGDDSEVIEHRLIALGVPDAVAAEVADNAFRLDER